MKINLDGLDFEKADSKQSVISEYRPEDQTFKSKLKTFWENQVKPAIGVKRSQEQNLARYHLSKQEAEKQIAGKDVTPEQKEGIREIIYDNWDDYVLEEYGNTTPAKENERMLQYGLTFAMAAGGASMLSEAESILGGLKVAAKGIGQYVLVDQALKRTVYSKIKEARTGEKASILQPVGLSEAIGIEKGSPLRAIGDTAEIAVSAGVLGGIKYMVKKNEMEILKTNLERFMPQIEQAGAVFPEGATMADKIALTLAAAQNDSKVGTMLARMSLIPTTMYSGVPVPKFNVGDLVKIGGKQFKINAISGATAKLIGEAGEAITAKLSELAPKEDIADNPEDTLIEEARKYKTAEEFVEAFDLFHGTPAEIEGGKLKFGAGQQLKKGGYMGGHFLTDQEQAAKAFQFGGQIYRASGKIKEKVFDVNKNKKLFKDFIGKKFKNQDGEMETFTKNHYDFMFPDGEDADWSTVYSDVVEEIAKPKGFIGMKIKEYAGGVDANTYQLWEDKIPIYTKQQLTDIWNKAQIQPQEQPQQPIEPQEQPTEQPQDPLIEEAKKYKSAEEFVEANESRKIQFAETGKPITVKLYHGSPDARFAEEFDPNKKGYYPQLPEALPDNTEFIAMGGKIRSGFAPKSITGNIGVSFTDDYTTAKSYANKPAFDYQNSVPMVLERYVTFKNPKVYDLGGKEWNLSMEEEMRKALNEGHDGLIFKNIRDDYHPSTRNKPTNNAIALNLDQIKTKSQITDIWNKAHEQKTSAEPEQSLIEEAKKYDKVEEFVSFMRGSATQYKPYNPKLRATVGVFEDSARISDLGIDPEMEVTIYRGVPDPKTQKIVDGDFVTVDRMSAESYSGKENVVSKKVKAKDLIADTSAEFDKDNPFPLGAEFVYSDSKNVLATYSDAQLTSIWNKAHGEEPPQEPPTPAKLPPKPPKPPIRVNFDEEGKFGSEGKPQPPMDTKEHLTSIKRDIHLATGKTKIGDIINIKESSLLKLKFRSEIKGTKEGIKVGKEIGKEKLAEYKQRQDANIRVKRALKEIFKKYKDPEHTVDFDTQEKINALQEFAKIDDKSTLKDMTIDELENLAQEVRNLKKRGREVYRRTRHIKHMKFEADKKALMDSMKASRSAVKPITAETTKETLPIKIKGEHSRVMRPLRLFDYLDGAKEYSGPHVNFFYEKADIATNKKIESLSIRKKQVSDLVSKLPKNWANQHQMIKGITLSNPERIGVYLFSKNPRRKLAVMYGNRMSEGTIQEIVNSLTEEERSFADNLQKIVGERYTDLRRVMIEELNRDVEKDENYFPLMRMRDFSSFLEEVDEEMLLRTALGGGNVEKGMTVSLKDIPPEFQVPVNLNAIDLALRSLENQEHLIHYLPLEKEWKRMINDRDYKQSLIGKIGKSGLRVIDKWIDHNLNPRMVYAFHEPVFTMLRKNVSLAYLGFNLVTMGKQFPSIAFALQYANLSDVMYGVKSVLLDYEKVKNFIYTQEPQIKNRKIERDIEELKQGPHRNKFLSIRDKVGEVGFLGIFGVDHIVVMSVWQAAYNNAIRQGFSQDEAVKRAHLAFINTQPQAAVKDLPDIYRSGEALKMLTQFTNQLNQIYEMLSYDIPKYAKRDPRKIFATALSILLSSTLIYMLSKGRLPKDEKETIEALTDSSIGSLPIIGSPIGSAIKGYGSGIDIPALKFVESSIGIVTAKKPETKLKRAAETAFLSLGIPGYSQGKRSMEGAFAQEIDPRKFVWGDKKEKSKAKSGNMGLKVNFNVNFNGIKF